MKKCYIVSGFKPIIKENYDGFLIGVDKGCLLLANRGFQIDVGIGDFDSVDEKEFEIIKKACKKLIKLNPIKDDTDFEHSLNFAKDNGYKDIEVYGVLGGRQDHNLLNIKLMYQSDLNIVLYDEYNKIFCLDKGKHIIKKDAYKYLSLFVFNKCLLSIKGTAYELKDRELSKSDNYTTSNEILNDECLLDIKQGRVLVVQASDKVL